MMRLIMKFIVIILISDKVIHADLQSAVKNWKNLHEKFGSGICSTERVVELEKDLDRCLKNAWTPMKNPCYFLEIINKCMDHFNECYSNQVLKQSKSAFFDLTIGKKYALKNYDQFRLITY